MKALLAAMALYCGAADAACRQALALGLDVSGSVDAREYRLQTDGLAAALLHPEIVEAFLALPDLPVSLAIYEWSGPGTQVIVQDWVAVRERAVLERVATRLRARAPQGADLTTAIGEAKAFGAALLARQEGCGRLVLDLSGDGKSNTGPEPREVRMAGITVNALVIGLPEKAWQRSPGIAELSAYFHSHVIDGPDAFVETALGFEAFEAAMVRKLWRELQVVVVGAR